MGKSCGRAPYHRPVPVDPVPPPLPGAVAPAARAGSPAPAGTLASAVARRFLVLRHLLAPPRTLPGGPASVMAVVARLGSLQFDPLEVAGRNHDLVLHARIAGYRRAWTDDLLYRERALYETYSKQLSIVPAAELPWFRTTWDRLAARHAAGILAEHADVAQALLARIRTEGPLAPAAARDHGTMAWYWGPTSRGRAVLEALAEAGVLGIARRDGNLRTYDLVERLFPADLLARRPGREEQVRHVLLSRYRGVGLLGATGEATLFAGTGPAAERAAHLAALVAGGDLVPVAVEGVRGTRYVVGDELPLLEQAAAEIAAEAAGAAWAPGGHPPGTTFLAPLDPLAWDRDLLEQLYGFRYRWEVYVPPAKRQYGWYALPLLHGDRFVGRVEPRFDRAAGTLRILGLWWEPGVDPLAVPGLPAAFAAALAAHRDLGGLRRVALPPGRAHRAFAAAVRDLLPPPPRG